MVDMDNEKQSVEHVEKAASDVTPREGDVHPEQDWTPEEERAVV